MKAASLILPLVFASVTPLLATVTVSNPTPNATVTSPALFAASATAPTCSKGPGSMGIYANNKLIYVVKAATLKATITLAVGPEHVAVKEWDNCGGSTYTAFNLTVKPAVAPLAPAVTINANVNASTEGSSYKLTVAATNSKAVTVTGSDGTSYKLGASGGTTTVYPAQKTTYTAEATGASSSTTASAKVTVSSAADMQKISHVIFMLQENRSFDEYFGMLNPYRKANGLDVSEDGIVYDVDGIDSKGSASSLFKFKTTCVDDENASWPASYGDVNSESLLNTRSTLMNGFARDRALGYYDETYLNYYYYMASQFAVSDRWFSPMASKTADNRIATFTGGTTQGLVLDPGVDDHLPQLDIPTIFQELDKAGVSWKIYYTVTQGYCLDDDDCGNSGHDRYPATNFSIFSYSYQYLYSKPSKTACVGPTVESSAVGDTTNSFCIDTAHIAPLSTYYSDLTNNTLPSFAFIEAGYGNNDEHPGPGQEILEGQQEVAKVINSFMDSSSWQNSVFFLSYDEGGGAYDHVPPVPGHSNEKTDGLLGTIPDIGQISVKPDGYEPCLPAGGTATTHCDLRAGYPGTHTGDAAAVNGFAAQLGFRVPNLIISPFTRMHYVSHTPMDHTAIIKFVENRFIGSSTHLTARDAAQPDLMEFFDFTKMPWATPPTPPVPVTDATLGYNTCTPTSM
jgi:phospholipase C